MFKKMIMVALWVTILVGCHNEDQSSVARSIRIVEPSEVLDLTTLFYVVEGSESNLILFDVLKNEILNEFALPDEEMEIRGPIKQLENGYIGVFGITGLMNGILYENLDVTMMLYLLDHQLNLVDEFYITDERVILNARNGAVLNYLDEWVIVYPGGIDLDGEEGVSNSIYI